MHKLELGFFKIWVRSDYTCGQRWGLFEQIFPPVVSRARGNARQRRTGPPEVCGALQLYFAWQRVEVSLRKLGGEAFLRRELADLTKTQPSAALEVEPTQLLRKTPL